MTLTQTAPDYHAHEQEASRPTVGDLATHASEGSSGEPRNPSATVRSQKR